MVDVGFGGGVVKAGKARGFSAGGGVTGRAGVLVSPYDFVRTAANGFCRPGSATPVEGLILPPLAADRPGSEVLN